MRVIHIQVFRGGPGGTDSRELVRSIEVPVDSKKRLTARRAQRVLVRTLPEFKDFLIGGVIRVEAGWEARRTIAPLPDCDYLYTWEYALVLDETGAV